MIRSVVIIGAGGVASSMAIAIRQAGISIVQVVSRSESAAQLAQQVDAESLTELSRVDRTADLYLLAVGDDALLEVVRLLPRVEGVLVHTSGSVPLTLFADRMEACGVFYPFQTFSRVRIRPLAGVPLFIEATDHALEERLLMFAHSLKAESYCLDSEGRRSLHLAGVFACNFPNHLYRVAEQQLAQAGLPFQVLLPLMEETLEKVRHHSPATVQTGPAVREDYSILQRHEAMLDDPHLREIYHLLSNDIIRNK